MNHRILTTSLSAFLAGACFVTAQETLDLEPTKTKPVPASTPVTKEVPVLKEIPVLKKLFAADTDSKKADQAVVKVKDGTITLQAGGGPSGKATITIDVNGKKETREIEFGNAAEIKISTDKSEALSYSADLKPARVTYLGIGPEELSEELAAQLPVDAGSGLLVRTVLPDSPAAQAGIQKNDVLIKLDDQTLSAPKQLQKLVASRKPGDTVKIIYLRRGQRAEVDAKLGEHEQQRNVLYLSRDANTKGENSQNFQLLLDGHDAKRVPFDPLSLQKKIVIVDKEGNVVAKDDAEAQQTEAIKRMAAEVDRMKDQAAAAQKQAQEAIRHAENAAREAAEVAKKEAAAIAERMRDAVRQLQEQLEKQQPQKREQ